MTRDYFVHPTALVETEEIGAGTRIWAHTHVMRGASIGRDCNICDGAFIESGVRIGRGVTVKTGVDICEGVTLEAGVFVGPNAVFTNDLAPRSPRLLAAHDRYQSKGWLRTTCVKTGAAIGANATILCGTTIGAWALVGAGSVVLHDVGPHVLVAGNPARVIRHVCACNAPLVFKADQARCPECRREYKLLAALVCAQQPIQLFEDQATA